MKQQNAKKLIPYHHHHHNLKDGSTEEEEGRELKYAPSKRTKESKVPFLSSIENICTDKKLHEMDKNIKNEMPEI